MEINKKDKKGKQENHENHEKDEKYEKELYTNYDNVSNYGEFITSYFSWIPLTYQKQRSEEMENMTKKKRRNENDM